MRQLPSRLRTSRLMIYLLAGLLISAATASQDCSRDTLAAVVKDNDRAAPYVLVTTGGRRLRAYGQDFINPTSWHSRDALSICTGPDSSSLRVRNLRRREDLVAATDHPASATAPLQILN